MHLEYYVILIIRIASCLGQQYAFRSDSASANMMCSAEKVQFSTTSVNDISCVRACSLTQNCHAVIFYHGNKTCFGLNTDDPFNESIPLPGAVFYKLTIAMSQRSARPSTTTAPTTAKAPTTGTTAPPTTTTIAPTTGTTALPTVTTPPQTTTTSPPTTTTAPPTVTTAQPTTTTSPPTVTTAPTTTTCITSAVIPDSASANMMCSAEKVQFSTTSVNDISCVRACSLTQNCHAVIFYHGNKTCFGLNTDDPFNESIPLPGAVFYKLTIAMSQRSARPSTTTAPTTAKAPTTGTTAPPTTTTIAPTTGTTALPTVTTPPQTTTTSPPTTTTAPPTVTTAQPTTTTSPPTVTTAPTTTTCITSAVIPGCVNPSAMVAGVANSQLSATSEYGTTVGPHRARLSDTNYWASQSNPAVGEHIQVDFLSLRVATAVTTKGCGAHSFDQRVTSYTISTSIDCITFNTILDCDGAEQVFPGNTDKYSPVTNNLEPPVSVLCLRIYPRTWNELIAMRFEVMGCIA